MTMNVNNPLLQTGLQGVQEGIKGAESAAQKIVRAGTQEGSSGSNDLVEPIVELKLYNRSVQASAQVVKTADEVLGTLLDTLA